MAASLRDSVERIADPAHLDASVEEVFGVMLGVECRKEREPVQPLPTVTAVVGFGGILSGACVLRCGNREATQMAARMTGTPFTAVEAIVKDAMGEICNMLAGAWKGRIPEIAGNCGLSLPAVITGSDYQLRVQAPEFEIRHSYRFADVAFDVTILCDGIH